MTEPTIVDKRPAVLELQPGTYYWCRCGRSKTQPWCDGSHTGTGFSPIEMTITETQRVALCLCKHTGQSPRCDGSHKNL